MDKILGLTIGEPFDQRTWSGSNYNFFSALKRSGRLYDVFNVDLDKWEKIVYSIPSFSLNRSKWRQNYLIQPLTFRKRSSNASRIAARHRKGAGAIVQIGAMFKVSDFPHPVATYCDGNLAISLKARGRSFTEHVSQDVIKKAFENEKGVYRGCSLVFTFSDWVRQSMIRDFEVPEDKVFAVGAGPNLNLSEGGGTGKEYDRKTILFIGKDFYRKGGDTVLKAFEIASREIKGLRLIIGGTAPLPGVDSKDIEFTGYIDKNTEEGKGKIIDLYKRASLFVMPSVFEPFGIVFLEAMMFRLPCIGSNICAMPEIIENGKTGFLIDPGDEKALARRFIDLLKDENLTREMGEGGFKRMTSLYTWDRVAEKVAAVMKDNIDKF